MKIQIEGTEEELELVEFYLRLGRNRFMNPVYPEESKRMRKRQGMTIKKVKTVERFRFRLKAVLESSPKTPNPGNH